MIITRPRRVMVLNRRRPLMTRRRLFASDCLQGVVLIPGVGRLTLIGQSPLPLIMAIVYLFRLRNLK